MKIAEAKSGLYDDVLKPPIETAAKAICSSAEQCVVERYRGEKQQRYSPDLAPSNFNLFSEMKEALGESCSRFARKIVMQTCSYFCK